MGYRPLRWGPAGEWYFGSHRVAVYGLSIGDQDELLALAAEPPSADTVRRLMAICGRCMPDASQSEIRSLTFEQATDVLALAAGDGA